MVVGRKLTVLWIRALKGSRAAYRELGKLYMKGRKQEQVLAKLCLEKSMDMGDEESLFIYHAYFARGRKVIDDQSYREMLADYRAASDAAQRRRLKRYLRMGTRRQRRYLRAGMQ